MYRPSQCLAVGYFFAWQCARRRAIMSGCVDLFAHFVALVCCLLQVVWACARAFPLSDMIDPLPLCVALCCVRLLFFAALELKVFASPFPHFRGGCWRARC